MTIGTWRALRHGKVAAGARLVFNKDALAQRFAKLAGRRLRRNFRAAPGGKRDQQANRFGRPGGLRARGQGASDCQYGRGLKGGAAGGV